MIPFHRFLIGTAIVFCAVFALWSHRMYLVSGGTIFRVLAAGFGAATVALCYYLMNLRRFLGR
jgi:hypothetical protein